MYTVLYSHQAITTQNKEGSKMTTELMQARFTEVSKAIRKVNTPDGITNAEVVAVENKRVVVYVKSTVISDFYNTLQDVGIYPLIIDSGSVYTLVIKLNEVDQPLFVAVD